MSEQDAPPPLPPIFGGPPTFDDPAVKEAIVSIKAEQQRRAEERERLFSNDPSGPPNPFIRYPVKPKGLTDSLPGYIAPFIDVIVGDPIGPYETGDTVNLASSLIAGTPRTTFWMWFINGAYQKGPLTLTDEATADQLLLTLHSGILNNINDDDIGTCVITVVAGNSGGMMSEESVLSVHHEPPPPP